MSQASTARSRPASAHSVLAGDLEAEYLRVNAPDGEPEPVRGVVDVAVLDMHFGYHNLGHQSIVETLSNVAREERAKLGPSAPEVRIVSFDVRRGHAVPRSASRYPIVVGTGGPGALDPRLNDGVVAFSQKVAEDPAWEAPLFRYFDGVLADKRTYLLGICHSFGVMARWSGVAEGVLRGAEKGGKSTGARPNLLTASAKHHPWFRGLYTASKGPKIQVLDSRLFDLIPTGRGDANVLAHESNADGSAGEAVTMIELERDEDGVGPRVWGVNHHPEIGDRGRQRAQLERLVERGQVSPEWAEERRGALDAWNESAATEKGLQWTASYTFEGPLRRIVAKTLLERQRLVRLP